MATTTRENGAGRAYLSQLRSKILPRAMALPIGTSAPSQARAAAIAPGATWKRGPRGPSTAKAASSVPFRKRRTIARSPRAPCFDEDPRSTRRPTMRSARDCSSPSFERLTSATVGRRRRQARSANCSPWKKANTQGRGSSRSSAGSSTTTRRRLLSHSRATRPTTMPRSLRKKKVTATSSSPRAAPSPFRAKPRSPARARASARRASCRRGDARSRPGSRRPRPW